MAQFANSSVRSSRAYEHRLSDAQSEMSLREIDPPTNNAHSKRSQPHGYIGDTKKVRIEQEMHNVNGDISSILGQIQQLLQPK